MRTLSTTFAFAVAFAAAAAAQPQSNDAPVNPPPMPAAPAAPSSPAGAGSGPFRVIDPAIKELAAETNDFSGGCLSALDYMRADLAATQRRLKARNGGKIPSNQAGLVALKIKRVGRQQQNCIDMTKQIGGHFDIAMRSLAGVEPSSHPGIPARRLKIVALREKFNAALKKMKVEGKSAAAPDADGGDSADDGSAQ